MMNKGKVWLVGAGPSDPGLFTLKGKSVLEGADVVVYDQLVGQGILSMIPKEAKKIDVGKKAGNHKVDQEDINKILLEEALKGNKVVRLKGGDPFLFGRGGEELELLCEAKIPFEIVPGITSAISVPAYAGIPVTHRDFSPSLHIITAHRKRGNYEPIDYDKLVALGEVTLVFLMGVSSLETISNGLIKAGMNKDTPAAILEKGTTSSQRRVVATIETLPLEATKASIGTPGIIVVGRVCSLAEKFHWAEDRVLGGARIIVAKEKERASKLIEELHTLGAEVVELPFVETLAIEDNKNLHDKLHNYKWIVFTSKTSVEIFFDYLKEHRIDIRTLMDVSFLALGSATKESLEDRGLLVDYMAEEYKGENLGKALTHLAGKDENILVFTKSDREEPSVKALKEENLSCDVIPLYTTVYEENDFLKLEQEDIALFTSPSRVKGFVNTIKDMSCKNIKAVCMDEETAKEARKHEMDVVLSDAASIESLIDKTVEVYNSIKE
ncbi:uroporphyrinogen-III C-methyltransferase [Clostridium simiarum]